MAATGRGAAGLPLALAALWTLLHGAVNSASVTNDLARRGVAFAPAEPWIWELSSALSLLLWLLPVLLFDQRLRARVTTWRARLVAYAAASLVFSLGHVLTMVALRHLAYRFIGQRYEFGPWLDGLLYEYRKDVLSFVAILVVAALWRLWAQRGRPAPSPSTQAPVAPGVASEAAAPAMPTSAGLSVPAAPTFIVRTATQGDLLVRADEVDWVEAQGNYVALHVGQELRLLRHTMAEMETRLRDHGFIRTHRRALVNRERMQAIIPPELGELGVRLSSGQIAPLSESRRAAVLRMVLGT